MKLQCQSRACTHSRTDGLLNEQAENKLLRSLQLVSWGGASTHTLPKHSRINTPPPRLPSPVSPKMAMQIRITQLLTRLPIPCRVQSGKMAKWQNRQGQGWGTEMEHMQEAGHINQITGICTTPHACSAAAHTLCLKHSMSRVGHTSTPTCPLKTRTACSPLLCHNMPLLCESFNLLSLTSPPPPTPSQPKQTLGRQHSSSPVQ